MNLVADTCYRALLSRDRRFDGTFFVGVTTTGVYCRPICPARSPRRDRCEFFHHAAEAERAGFRACFRCRPELSPGLASVDANARLASRATRRIDEGALDDAGLDSLATELGVTARHLRRAFQTELGVSPLEYAQTRRLALAKHLMTDAQLRLTDVAFSAGYRSIRRFNAEFRERFGCSPRESKLSSDRKREQGSDHISLRLDYRPPYDWDAILAFLRLRAVAGVELVDETSYTRALSLAGASGIVRIEKARHESSLLVTMSLSLSRVLPAVVSRTRALFDLDAQPDVIASVLEKDPIASTLIRKRPGLRVPGTLDPFEASLRAVLAQQVSVRAARTLGERVVNLFGRDVVNGMRVFPDAKSLAARRPEEIAKIGIPLARANALRELARAVASGGVDLSGASDAETVQARILELPGMGPFSANVIAMRALHWPDAFPSNDMFVLRALGVRTAPQADARTTHLRPFRAYYVMHLWQQVTDREGVES